MTNEPHLRDRVQKCVKPRKSKGSGLPSPSSSRCLALANVYLHYVYDLWTHRWRRKATGDVIVTRYADDSIGSRRLCW
jgi:hypothetical protein